MTNFEPVRGFVIVDHMNRENPISVYRTEGSYHETPCLIIPAKPSDATIERCATALFGGNWLGEAEDYKNIWRREAGIILTAALTPPETEK